jgi:hypothetical protein
MAARSAGGRRATRFSRVSGIAVWLIVTMWGSPGSGLAQQNNQSSKWYTWRFEPHSYYDPLAAEPRSAETKLLFLGRGRKRKDKIRGEERELD